MSKDYSRVGTLAGLMFAFIAMAASGPSWLCTGLLMFGIYIDLLGLMKWAWTIGDDQ